MDPVSPFSPLFQTQSDSPPLVGAHSILGEARDSLILSMWREIRNKILAGKRKGDFCGKSVTFCYVRRSDINDMVAKTSFKKENFLVFLYNPSVGLCR
jgi:hypothetical protein